MPQIGSFSVAIVNAKLGTPFEELMPKINEEGKAECYIQCQTGTEFEISTALDSPLKETDRTFMAKLLIDGKELNGLRLCGHTSSRATYHQSTCGIIKGLYTSPSTLVPFVFGATRLHEGVGFIDKDTFAHLGKIVVEFYEVEVLGKGTGFGANCAKAAIAEAEKSIDERAKKAQITHSVKYGTPVIAPERNFYEFRYISKSPLQTATFHYHMLKAMKILDAEPLTSSQESGDEDSLENSPRKRENEIAAAQEILKLKTEIQLLKRKIKEEPRLSPEVLDLTSGERKKKRKIVVDLTELD